MQLNGHLYMSEVPFYEKNTSKVKRSNTAMIVVMVLTVLVTLKPIKNNCPFIVVKNEITSILAAVFNNELGCVYIFIRYLFFSLIN